MTVHIVVIGAGGFARETLGVAEAICRRSPGTIRVVGVVDDAPSARDLELLDALGVEYLGPVTPWVRSAPSGSRAVIAIGTPTTRAMIDAMLLKHGITAATLVHPTATLGPLTELDAGSVVCAGAHISTNVHLGRHTHVGAGALLGHDTTAGPYVSINPGAVVSGSVAIGPRTLIGAGATVLQGLRVGADTVVGASACVTRSIAAGVTVVGVPARPVSSS